MKIVLPEEVLFILNRLNDSGFDAYVVGGCVRDSIIGRKPSDWDITTNAKPVQVKELFEKTYDTGIQHGTVTAIINGNSYEITTYRVEGEYKDNRRPSSVDFTHSLEKDLSRRDFTSNAIAYNPNKGYMDPFCGRDDIEGRIIRAVGNANQRYKEDALRMLRAVRFSAQLGFTIERSTFDAISQNSSLIKNVSSERIRYELTELILSDNPLDFGLLMDSGLLEFIIPEFAKCFRTEQNNPWHVYNVAEHSLKAVGFAEKDKCLRWTLLLHDIGKAYCRTTDEKGIDHFYGHEKISQYLARKILTRLRFDNATIRKALRLIKHHDINIKPDLKAVRRAIAEIGDDIFDLILKVKEADKRAQNPSKLKDGMKALDIIKDLYNTIKENKDCVSRKDLAINGNDLIELGIRPGKDMGRLLEELFALVLEEPHMNTKQELLNYLKSASDK